MAKKKKPDWYTLDNAGILYSALQKEEYSAIYRFSAVLKERVDPAALQRAVDECMPRFPGFAVRIKRGAFWYYFEPNSAPGPFVKPDISNPCQPVRFKEDNGWLIRFYYYRDQDLPGGVPRPVRRRRGADLFSDRAGGLFPGDRA